MVDDSDPKPAKAGNKPQGHEKLEIKLRGANSLKQLIALRVAVLVPPNRTLDDKVLNQLPADAIFCYVGEIGNTTNIEIYADELILIRDIYYFREKSLSISCREAKFVGAQDQDQITFVFDPERVPATPATREAQTATVSAASRPENIDPREFVTPWDTIFPQFTMAGTGSQGLTGTDGATGFTAGNFKFRGTFSLSKDEKIKFVVNVQGGKGGNGGTGGAGGAGGDAIPAPKSGGHYRLPNTKAWNQILPYMNGGQGGRGGTGGKGGTSGNSGSIDIVYSLLVDGQESTDESLLNFDLSHQPRENGVAGGGGAGGTGGDHGKFQFWVEDFGIWVPPEDWVTRQQTGRESSGQFREQWRYTMVPDKMGRGANGDTGSTGNANTDKGADGTVNVSRNTQAELLKVQTFDAHHLSMVLDRISFEYFTQFAAQIYDPQALASDSTDSNPTPRQLQIAKTWGWVSDVLSSRNMSGDEADAWKILKGSLVSFNAQCLARSDMFKQPLNAVPDPAVDIPDLNTAIDNYKIVEAAALKTREAIVVTDRKREDVYKQLSALTDTTAKLKKQQNVELSESDRLIREISQAIALQDLRRVDLVSACSDLTDQIKAAMDKCDVEKIIDGVRDVVLDSWGVKPGKLIGNVLKLNETAANDWKKSTDSLGTDSGGRVKKEFIYDRINTFTSGTKDLYDNLAATMKETEAARAKDDKYLARLQVSAQKFEQMRDSYIDQLKPQDNADKVRKAFGDLMDSIQYKSKVLLDYNNCQARRLQVENDLEATGIMIKKQTDTAGEMSNTDLQLVGAFLSKAESDIGRDAFEAVYYAARNFNCVSLGPTSVFQSLDPLQSFAGINSTILDAAVKTYLIGQDITAFEKDRGGFEGNTEPITVTVDEKIAPGMFQTLKWTETEYDQDTKTSKVVEKTGTQLTVHLAAGSTKGFNKTWWDVRLQSLEIYLIGAVQKEDSPPDPEKTTAKIGMDIHTPGLMSYRDRLSNSKLHEFQLPPVYTSFDYTYQKHNKGQKPFTPSSEPVEPVHMKFSLGDRKLALPMQSPFATWIIEPSDDVDVSNCHTVEMVFNVAYLAGKKK